jgi:plasmid stabilization system protein ParE
MRVRLLPAAERDLEAGADFYESQQKGLGAYFNDALTADIESLQLFGGIHEKHRGFHRALSKRFPFAIYYFLDGNVVNIIAVLDCRQDPETINRILESPRTM